MGTMGRRSGCGWRVPRWHHRPAALPRDRGQYTVGRLAAGRAADAAGAKCPVREVSLRSASLARPTASRMVWADLGHRKGLAAWVSCVSMKWRMAARSSVTRVKMPRRRARRSNWPHQVSTALSHDPLVGVIVQLNAGMGGQDVPNRLGRVRPAVVDDQVQLEVGRRRAIDLREELAARGGAMAPGDPSNHLAGRDVEGRIQIRGPVSRVVVGAALDLPGPQGQHRMGPVARLHLRLFVDREDQRVVGRVEEAPDHIDHRLGELRVVTEREGLEPMRRDVGGLPDLPHLPLGDAGVPSHQPRAPMGGLHRYAFGRQEQDALDGSSVEQPSVAPTGRGPPGRRDPPRDSGGATGARSTD